MTVAARLLFTITLLAAGPNRLASAAATFPANGPAPSDSSALVCIDPGHPSEVNSGKTVQNGTTEVHVAWVVAGKLRDRLQQARIRTVMTKSTEDELVRNKDRALIANRAGAALMVRLHCDASPDSGFAVYYPDRTGTIGKVTGPSVQVKEQSRQAALAIREAMTGRLAGQLKDGGARGDSKTLIGSRQGALTGSIFSTVPVVTVEMVVLSHPRDATFIKSAAGEDSMAAAIAAGILSFRRQPVASTPKSGPR